MRRVLLIVALGMVVAVSGLIAWIHFTWNRHFDAPYPDIRASSDPALIERGRYLAFGPAHCAGCHVAPENGAKLAAGDQPPLSGGSKFRLGDLGVIWSANLTPDPATGIGSMTDGEVARVLRYGVHQDGRAVLPFMEYQTLSDQDLTALISFLRSQASVARAAPPMQVKFKGKLALAFFVKPQGPKVSPPVTTPDVSDVLAYGGYLVEAVAQCAGCHTDRSTTDGSDNGPRLAGGWMRTLDDYPGVTLVTPNLTPDRRTGRIAKWSEDDFVNRFRAGKLYKESDMPWAMYARMTDEDLRAIYRYLRSLAPVKKDTGASVRRAG